jgi:tetratricopeptide (TPR) repeat protein
MARTERGERRSAKRPDQMAQVSSKANLRSGTTIGGESLPHTSGLRWASPQVLGVVALAAVLLYVGITQARRSVYTSRLSTLPDLRGQQQAVVEHLGERYRTARSAPTSVAAVSALCLAYHADMYYTHAERCYRHAEALSPNDWRWTYYRALIQHERGNGNAVAEILGRVVGIAPDYSPAWWRLGEAEFKEGRYDRAEQAWRRALSLREPERAPAESAPHLVEAPISMYASFGLARIALVRKDAGAAREILEPVTSSAPRFGSAFRLLAEAYELLDRPADATTARYRANRLPPYAPYADPMVSALARESRNSTFLLRQASEADLSVNATWSEYLTRKALAFDPENPDVLSKLGRVLRTLGRTEEALEFFKRYHNQVPGDFQGLAQIGSCLSDLGRYEEAEPFLRRALEGGEDALTHYNLGTLLSQTGRFEEAVREYERALSLDGSDVDARGNLAVVLVRLGKLERARRELTQILAIDPANAAAPTNLGLVLAEQGHLDRAAREFREALRIDPQQIQASEALKALGR